ncbi:MAG: hypothetical protein JW958_03905 [Candidatus Eisenbacteria bacterium]|nr:hypothetical protein [Candidatus Eisenbacteria bacterium]
MKGSIRGLLLWAIAAAITVGAAGHQRATGPTYPLEEKVRLGSRETVVVFERSHGGPGDQTVEAAGLSRTAEGDLLWRRYPTDDPFESAPMTREGDRLVGRIPHQPPAGKIEYSLLLRDGSERVRAPADRTVVTRFKGAVPAAVLVPHILLMFVAMLFSNRTGVEAIRNGPRLAVYARITFLFLLAGGMILGPVVQKFAFGAFWTGVPLGFDLTDNKTLVAFLGWIAALAALRRRARSARWWVFAAALLLFAIYLIPHSMMGSELDWESAPVR